MEGVTVALQEQIQEKWLIFLWALGMGLMTMGVALKLGLFRPCFNGPYPNIRGKDVLKGFGFFLFAELLIVPSVVGLVLKTSGQTINSVTSETRGWINFAIICSGFIAVFLAYLRLPLIERKSLWGTGKDPWYSHLFIGIAAWWATYPLILAFGEGLSLILWHLFHHSFEEQIAVQNLRNALSSPTIFGLTAFAIVFLVPMTEEFLFRGLLQSWLKKRLKSKTIAVVLTSFVFALFHFSSSQGIGNIDLLSSLFLLSLLLGYIYERESSLWGPIGLHGFFNFISLSMIVLQSN